MTLLGGLPPFPAMRDCDHRTIPAWPLTTSLPGAAELLKSLPWRKCILCVLSFDGDSRDAHEDVKPTEGRWNIPFDKDDGGDEEDGDDSGLEEESVWKSPLGRREGWDEVTLCAFFLPPG